MVRRSPNGILFPGNRNLIAVLQWLIYFKASNPAAFISKLAFDSGVMGCDGLGSGGAALVAFEQVDFIKFGCLGNAVNFCCQLLDFGIDGIAVGFGICPVCSLRSQLIHTLQHGMHFGQCAFCGLYGGDAVLGVGGSAV